MTEALELMQYVFAGLVASWVYYGLTPYKRPTPFERVVQALIYTAAIRLLAEFAVAAVGEGFWAESVADAEGGKKLAATSALVLALSLALGFVLALAANNNWPHKWLVRFPPEWLDRVPPEGKWMEWLWKITGQSTHDNNLSYAMETRNGEYVVLVLKNGRRIYGWPESWPDHPDEDFFLLVAYEWLPGPRDDADAVAAANEKIHPNGAILIAAKDVDVIEFIPNEETTPNKEPMP